MKKVLVVFVALIICVLSMTACNNTDLNCVKSDDQLAALTEVKAGTSDIAVIDSIMANYYVNKSNFSDLQVLKGEDFLFENEYYAIGFRKGGNTAEYVNYALYAVQQSGKLAEINTKYGLTSEAVTFEAIAKPSDPEANSDFGKIKANGKLVLGYTLFEPIAYTENDVLVGYDIELAKAVCEVLGIQLECKKINWDFKEDELTNATIDCVWNGFTYTDERAENISFSNKYLMNKQAIVIRKADAEKYTSYASMKSAKFVAEGGSAGETTVKEIIKAKIFG